MPVDCCAFCLKRVGHTAECQVLRHGLDPARHRGKLGLVSAGTPHARMLATWERMELFVGDLHELVGYNLADSKGTLEVAFVDAFKKLLDERREWPRTKPEIEVGR